MFNSILKCAESFEKRARAIPINKSEIADMSLILEKVIAENLKYTKGTFAGVFDTIARLNYQMQSVDEKEITVTIAIKDNNVVDDINYVLDAGIGYNKNKEIVIIIYINSAIPAEKYQNTGNLIANQLYKVLIHELSHAAELEFVESKIHTINDDFNTYYNRPSEVKAYMQEVIDELEGYAKHWHKFRDNKGFDTLLGMSSTWNKVSGYWTEDNKRTVMTSVFKMLENNA